MSPSPVVRSLPDFNVNDQSQRSEKPQGNTELLETR
jgi:hypothetical protein